MNPSTRPAGGIAATVALATALAASAQTPAGDAAEQSLQTTSRQEYAAYRTAWRALAAAAPGAFDIAQSAGASFAAAAQALEAAAPHQEALQDAAWQNATAAREAWERAAAEEIAAGKTATTAYLALEPQDPGYEAAAQAFIDAIYARKAAAPQARALSDAAYAAAEAAEQALQAAAPIEHAAKELAFAATLAANTELDAAAPDELPAFGEARGTLAAAPPEEYAAWLPQSSWKEPTR